MQAGVVMVPVNWRLAGPEIAVIVADSEARLILVGPEFAATVETELPAMPRVATIIAAEGNHPTWPDFAAWRDAQSPGAAPEIPLSPHDCAVQLYTSGTTGRPKGVMLSHHNFVHSIHANAQSPAAWTQWKDGDSAIQAMPVSHISGTGWGIITVHFGATCHIQRQFDIDMTIDMILNDRINKIFLVPAAMQFLVRHPRAKGADFSCIREMGYGASPIPLALLRECMDVLGCGFVQFYGMTESTGAGAYLSPGAHDRPDLLTSCGGVWPEVEMAIVGPTGVALPDGEIGEIVIRGDIVMKGYWNRPEATAETLAGGWLRTGDAGFRDSEGYFHIHDRMKDMVVTGGENVYPAEVENAIFGCPGVADVAVIGVPDAKWGEAVKAMVVAAPGARPAPEDIIAWARARIAGYKAPKSVDFVDVLPRNPSGKVLRRQLREPYWAGRDRAIG
jgi:fatty-acyl-CoA synthase